MKTQLKFIILPIVFASLYYAITIVKVFRCCPIIIQGYLLRCVTCLIVAAL